MLRVLLACHTPILKSSWRCLGEPAIWEKFGSPVVQRRSYMSDNKNTEPPKEAAEAKEAKGKQQKPKGEKPKGEKPKQEQKPKAQQGEKKADKGAKELLGVGVKKEDDFSEWYTNTITRAEMIEYYDISGCYILRPWAYAIWEKIQEFVNVEIKKLGVQNAYFPLLVSERALTAEKDHIEGFAPEVAWVTKAGQSDLAEKVAIRPTSETIMYPAYSTWIRSHRDLPLRLNQWGSVVRWEFKHPVPFIRCREFLWQEGHTAFAHKAEADEEVLQILDIYSRVYSELLAMPCVKGMKSEKEKFAGGLYTTTCEAFIPANGRGLQGATSHCLGQNFAKMFHIEFEDDKGNKQLAWQNSWGLTIRAIGAMIMVHGDNNGLMLPPRVAPLQVVIIPILGKDNSGINRVAPELLKALKDAGVRVQYDDRDNYKPGWKYNHWELRGVPIRVELGPKDVEAGTVVIARRDTGQKEIIQQADLAKVVVQRLEDIQAAMLAKATAERDDHIVKVTEWAQFVPALDGKNITLCAWCDTTACEDAVKKRSGEESLKVKAEENTGFRLTGAAKTLCIPFNQPELPAGTKCFACDNLAKKWTLFGRSY